MPFTTKSDGEIVIETVVIMKYLAELGGKFVVDDFQAELASIGNDCPKGLQMADHLWNLPEEMSKGLGDLPLDDWVKTLGGPIFKDLAGKLGDKPFFAGEKPGYGECQIWHNLDVSLPLAKDKLTAEIGEEAMAKLVTWNERFAALDGIKEYLAARPKAFGMPGSPAHAYYSAA